MQYTESKWVMAAKEKLNAGHYYKYVIFIAHCVQVDMETCIFI